MRKERPHRKITTINIWNKKFVDIRRTKEAAFWYKRVQTCINEKLRIGRKDRKTIVRPNTGHHPILLTMTDVQFISRSRGNSSSFTPRHVVNLGWLKGLGQPPTSFRLSVENQKLLPLVYGGWGKWVCCLFQLTLLWRKVQIINFVENNKNLGKHWLVWN